MGTRERQIRADHLRPGMRVASAGRVVIRRPVRLLSLRPARKPGGGWPTVVELRSERDDRGRAVVAAVLSDRRDGLAAWYPADLVTIVDGP